MQHSTHVTHGSAMRVNL